MPGKSKLGSGKRFAALEKSIDKNSKVDNPEAVAASIGRKKYGQKKMTRMATAAKRRKK